MDERSHLFYVNTYQKFVICYFRGGNVARIFIGGAGPRIQFQDGTKSNSCNPREKMRLRRAVPRSSFCPRKPALRGIEWRVLSAEFSGRTFPFYFLKGAPLGGN